MGETTLNADFASNYRPYILNGFTRTCKAKYTPGSATKTTKKVGEAIDVKIGTGTDNRKAILLQDITTEATTAVEVEVLYQGDIPKSLYSNVKEADEVALAKDGILIREDTYGNNS